MSQEPSDGNFYQGDINEAAAYADRMRRNGQSLRDYIASDSSVEGLPNSGEGPESILDFYEQNPNRQLDLDAPDAESHWNEIVNAFGERHTDYMKLFGDTASEIASLPLHLAEGMIEQPNPLVWAGSTIEGTGRALRDMWGLASQSENPTSPLFRFKGAMNAMINGKPSSNWRDDAQQWNDARRFLWHSAKIQNGDEVLLDQVTNLNDRDRETIKSFINPKVAHAMGYIGLELPAIASSVFTAGAGTAAAIEAGTALTNAASRAAKMQKVGMSLGNLTTKFENYASKVANKMVEKTAGAVGSALEAPAALAGRVIGGTSEAIAGRVGRSSAEIRNLAESAALDLSKEVGAGEVQATVGLLGSLGLRTTSEVIKEIGYQSGLRAAGVVESSSTTGLTILERTALAPLSKSAQNAAKFLSYTVDPVLQMSTAALKSSYKGAFEFGLLGYLNDRDKGAVSGAAMGMVWSGYSGAVRHIWSSFSGANSHAMIIKDFDERAMPHYEKLNPEFATAARTLISDADRAGSTKISANIRKVIQMAADSCRTDLKDFIFHMGTGDSLMQRLTSEGLVPKDDLKVAGDQSKGLFYYVHDSARQKLRPIVFVNDYRGHRAADVAHEIMGHMLTHSLHVNGHLGEFMHQFFGTKKDGGLVSDKAYIDQAAMTAAVQVASIHQRVLFAEYEALTGRKVPNNGSPLSDPSVRDFVNRRSKEIYSDLQEHFTDVMSQVRLQFDSADKFLTSSGGMPRLYDLVRGDVRTDSNGNAINRKLEWLHRSGLKFGAQFMFEETIASRSEHLFTHTNLSSLTTPDSLMPVRLMLEAKRDAMLASNLTQLELSGIRIQNSEFFNAKGEPVQQAIVYDNGKFVRWPEMDSFIRSYVRKAIGQDLVPVMRLSPERQAVEAKRFGKEFLFNPAKAGMTMKGTKEVNEILSDRAKQAFDVISKMDESIRPEIITDEHGNARVDLSKLNITAWDILSKSGVMDETTSNYGKIIGDVMKNWEKSGFATPNILTCVYWGDSHEIIRNGILERLKGKDVPITHRVLVPFEMNMTMRITDANGRRLKNPRYGITVTAVDYLAIHRRKIQAWARGDVQSLFVGGIGHMNSTFDTYLINLMQEPSKRVPSEQLFTSEFGANAAKVRDVCHQIFGAVLRQDESYINTPIDGHVNKRGPNFPIHSLKLELMVDLGKTAGTAFPYHHGRSYEPLRRNLSVAGFERVGKKERFVNSNGYEILKSGSKYKVFNPFGKLLDVVDSIAKGSRLAEKDLKKLDPADMMPSPTEGFSVTPDVFGNTEASYTDANGAQLSAFSSDGSMKSIMGIINGRWHRFDEELEPSWAKLSSIIGQNLSRVASSDQRASLYDILTPASKAALQKFNKDSGQKFDIGKIRILPIIPADNPSIDASFGVRHETTGRYFHMGYDEHTKGIAIYLDMDYLNGLSSEKERTTLVNSAIKQSTMALTRHLDGDFIYGAGPFIRRIEERGKDYPQLDLHVAEAYRRAYSNRDKIDENQRVARAAYNEKIKHLESSGFRDSVAALELGEYPWWNDQNKNKVPKEFSGVHAGINRILNERNLSGKLNGVSKAEQIEIGTGIRIASEMALIAKDSDFGTHLDSSGILRTIPAYLDSEGKMSEKISELEAWVSKNKDSNPDIVSLVSEISSEHILHALFQIGGDEGYANLSEDSGVRLSAKFRKKPSSTPPTSFISSARMFAESMDSAAHAPVIVFLKKDSASRRGVQLASELGHVIVIEKGKNEFGGSRFGQNEPVPSKSQQKAGYNRVYMDGGFPSTRSIDAVLADLINGSHISDNAVKRMNHLHVVASEILHINSGLHGEVMKLFKDYETNGDRVKLAEKLAEIAGSEGIESAVLPAYAALGIEKAMDDGFVSRRFAGITDGNSPIGDYKAAALREAKSHWNQAMRHYWSIQTGEAKELSTKLHGALDSLYGMRFFKDNMSQADIVRIKEHAVKQSQINSKLFRKETKKMGPKDSLSFYIGKNPYGVRNLMRSIAGIDSLRDQSRISDLVDLGLVKVMYDRNGTPIHTFEFSDSQAGLNVVKNRNKTFLTPFVGEKNPEFAFDKYKERVELSGKITGDLISTAKLSDVFQHDTLYYYYPELRDMKVEFFDGFGGQYASPLNSGGERIRIGARNFCGPELMRSMTAKESGNYLRSKESLMERYASKNPAASIILHEIQHALQHRTAGMDRSIPLTYPSKRIMTGYFANLMGVTGNIQVNDLNTKKIESTFGKDVVVKAIESEDSVVDGRSYYDSLSPDEKTSAAIIDSLAGSPVFSSLKHYAQPMLNSVLSQLSGYVAEYHERGKVPLHFAERVMDAYELSKGHLTDSELFDLALEVEDINRVSFKHPEMGVHMIGDTEYKATMSAISVYTSIGAAKEATSMTEKLSMMRHAVSAYTNADYMMSAMEMMARETQRRSGMSNQELSMNPRKDFGGFQFGSVLDLVERAFESSTVLKPSDLRKAVTANYENPNSGKVGVVMKSIGGIMPHDKDNKVLSSMAKAMIVHYLGVAASRELRALGRVAYQQRGWELGADGKLVLKDKVYMLKGNAISSGNFPFPTGDTGFSGFEPANKNFKGLEEHNPERTISIEDICRLADCVIESEEGLSIGSPAMDAVFANSFPEITKGSQLVELMEAHGVKRGSDAFELAEIDSIARNFEDVDLTKNDIGNLIALRHRMFQHGSVRYGESRTLPSQRNLDVSQPNTLDAIRALTTTEVGKSAVAVVRDSLGYTADHDTMTIGAYRFDKNTIKFELANKPSWIPQKVWDDAVQRHMNSVFEENLRKVFSGREADDVARIVENLNGRLAKKLLLIKPYMEQALKQAMDYKKDGKYPEFISALLDENFKAHLEIAANAANLGSEFLYGGETGPRVTNSLTKAVRENSLERARVSHLERGLGRTAQNGLTEYGIPPLFVGHAWHGIAQDLREATTVNTSTVYNAEPVPSMYGNYAYELSNQMEGKVEKTQAELMGLPSGDARIAINKAITAPDRALATIAYNAYQYNRESGVIAMYMRDVVGNAVSHYEEANHDASNRIDDLERSKDGKTEDEKAAIQEKINSIVEARSGLSRDKKLLDGLQSMYSEAVASTSESNPDNGRMGFRVVSGQRNNANQRDIVPSSSVQAFKIGDRVYFAPDILIPERESTNSISMDYGMTSGLEPIARNLNAKHSIYPDVMYPVLMNSEVRSRPNAGAETQKITPYDRYSVLIEHLGQVHRNGDDGVYFKAPSTEPMPYMQSMLGGGALVEHGLFTYAYSVANEFGATSVGMFAGSVGHEELSRVFNHPESAINKAVLDVPRKFVEGDKNGVSVSPVVFGVMSSPLVAMLLAKPVVFNDAGSPSFRRLKITDNMHYQRVKELADAGEYSKHISEISQEARASLEQFIASVDTKEMDRLVIELSSINNINTISAAIGASMAYQLADIQKQDPQAFQHTIKTQFVPTQGGEPYHGVSLRNAIDYSLINSEHLRHNGTEAAGDTKAYGSPVGHAKVFAQNLPVVVKTPEFWHGYFSSLKKHEEIAVAKMTPDMDSIGADYVHRGSGAPSEADQAVMMNDGYQYLRQASIISAARFIPEVHSFGQTMPYIHTPIGIVNIHYAGNHGGQTIIRQGLDLFNPKTEQRRKLYKVTEGSTSLRSLVEMWHDHETESTEREILDTSGLEGVKKDEQSGKVRLPVVRDAVSKAVRGKLIREQLALAAKSLGADRVSSPAARYQVSGRIPSMFMGLSSSERYNGLESASRRAFQGLGGELVPHSGTNDIPRLGVSWKRLQDGRIMINYSPDIDIPMLADLTYSPRSKVRMGINYRNGIGFDATSGTIIPQSYLRMAQITEKLQTGSMRQSGASRYLNSLIHFDKGVMKEYGDAIRMIGNDLPNDNRSSSELNGLKHDEKSMGSYVRTIMEAAYGEGSGMYIPEIDTSSGNPAALERKHLVGISQMDQLIHFSNHSNSYMTIVLPSDAKPEHIQSAITSMHLADHSFGGGGLIGISNSSLSGALDFGRDQSSYYIDVAKGSFMKERAIARAEGGMYADLAVNTGENAVTSKDKEAMQAFRLSARRNPNLIQDIVDASHRIHGSNGGYFVPEAERKLKLHGDRDAAIKLLFPNRPDLSHYSWDSKAGGPNISITKRSGNAGYFVSHDVVVGVDSNGNPKSSRKVMPFRTESDANNYASSLQQNSTRAHIPSGMFGNDGKYEVESLGQTNLMDAEVSPVLGLSFSESSPNIHSESETQYKVGDIEAKMTKKEAEAAKRLLLSNDVVSGKAPESGPIMLSTGGIGIDAIGKTPEELERLVKQGLSFGTAGSIYHFSSKAMRALAYGNDRNKNFKHAMTGKQLFDLLEFHGVSKHEMRVTGLADLLYRNRENMISRQEASEFVASTYPFFGRHVMGRKIETGHGYHWPVVTSGQWANERNTSRYISRVGAVETKLNQLLEESAIGGPKSQIVDNLRQTIRDSFKSAIAEVFGKEVADGIPSTMNVADYLNTEVDSDGKKSSRINAQTLELFRRTMIDRLHDKTIQEACAVHGIDVGNLFDGFADEPAKGGMPMEKQREFYGKAAYDTTGVKDASSTSSQLWDAYSSGIGPYHVHLLHGHVTDEPRLAQIRKYIATIDSRISVTTDEAQLSKLKAIRQSAENVLNVRKAIANSLNNSGHWTSPSGTMQYSHLRTSMGASMVSTNIGSGYLDLAYSVKDPIEITPISFIEELQSDPYQRRTFGVTGTDVALAGDMKEAEGMQYAGEVSAIKGQIDVEAKRVDNAVSSMTKLTRLHPSIAQNLMAHTFEWRFNNASSIVKHLMIEKFKSDVSGSPFDVHLQDVIKEDNANPVRISKAMQDKFGLPPVIPNYSLNKSSPYYKAVMMNLGVKSVAGDMASTQMFDISGLALRRLYGDQKLPNSPMTASDMNSQGNVFTLYKQIVFNEMHYDEDFAANLPKFAETARAHDLFDNKYDFDSLMRRCAKSFRDRVSYNQEISAPQRIALMHIAHDLEQLTSVSGAGFIDALRLPSSPRDVVMHFPDTNGLEKIREHIDTAGRKRVYVTDRTVWSNLNRSVNRTESPYWPSEITSGGRPLTADTGQLHELTPAQALRVEARLMLALKGYSVERMVESLGSFEQNSESAKLIREIVLGEDTSSIDDKFKELIMSDEFRERNHGFNFRYLHTVDEDLDVNSQREYSYGMVGPVSRQFNARSYGGRFAEKLADSAVEGYMSLSATQKLAELEAKKAELEKKIGFVVGDYNYPNTIPLGEDNAYRGMSINFLVMDALQQGKEALAWADARHHRSRYSSTLYTRHFVFNKLDGKVHIKALDNNAWQHGGAYVINLANDKGTHGGFIKAVTEGTLPVESESKMFEWNGINGTIRDHAYQAFLEAFGDGSKDGELYNAHREMATKMAEHYANAVTNSRHMLDAETVKSIVGDLSGSGDDVARKAFKAGTSNMAAVSVPYDKMHGYAVNYGIPQWMAEIQYSGQGKSSILAVSHDAFEVPVVAFDPATSSYSLHDKTGKALLAGITDKKMMEERRAQLSKYLGNVPFVTNFIKQYGKAGGHVKRAHMFSGYAHGSGDFGLKNTSPELTQEIHNVAMQTGAFSSETTQPVGSELAEKLKTSVMHRNEGSTGDALGTDNTLTDTRGSVKRGLGLYSELSDGNHPTSQRMMALALYSMGVREGASHSEIASAINEGIGFNSPMLVIKPKFPTLDHAKAMRELIVKGVPLLSVGSIGGKPMVNAAKGIYKAYVTPNIKLLGPIQRRGRDDE